MSLDPHPSPDWLLQRKAALDARRGGGARPPLAIEPGPGSVLRPTPRPAPARIPDRPRTRQLEHDLQAEVFVWANDPAEQLRHPELALLHAIPNGGHRTPRTAGRQKAEGVKPGVPDLDLPAARGGYHGLRIELKRPGGTTSPEQAHWMAALAREGHRVALHSTVEGTIAEVLAYLALPRT